MKKYKNEPQWKTAAELLKFNFYTITKDDLMNKVKQNYVQNPRLCFQQIRISGLEANTKSINGMKSHIKNKLKSSDYCVRSKTFIKKTANNERVKIVVIGAAKSYYYQEEHISVDVKYVGITVEVKDFNRNRTLRIV